MGDSCGCRIRDNMMLLSLTLAAVASLASSESGISYTAEPFKADQQQLAHITYTAEPFKTEFKPINTNAAIQPFTTYASLPRTYTPINTLSSSSSSSYSYALPLSYNAFPAVSNLYTNSLTSLTSSNWFYNSRPISRESSNIVPASTRTIPSSPLVRALYNPAIVQPLTATKQMAKREAEAGMTYTAEPFESKSMLTYTAEPFKSKKTTLSPPRLAYQPLSVPKPAYSGMPSNFAYTYQRPVSYNSFITPTSYPTAYTLPYTLPYTSSYMQPTRIQPSTYTYTTHLSNFGLCLNNLGAQVPC